MASCVVCKTKTSVAPTYNGIAVKCRDCLMLSQSGSGPVRQKTHDQQIAALLKEWEQDKEQGLGQGQGQGQEQEQEPAAKKRKTTSSLTNYFFEPRQE